MTRPQSSSQRGWQKPSRERHVASRPQLAFEGDRIVVKKQDDEEEERRRTPTAAEIILASSIAVVAEPVLRNLILAVFNDVGRSTRLQEIEVALRSLRLAESFAKTKAREVEGLVRPHVENSVENVAREAVPTALDISSRQFLSVADAAAAHAKKFAAQHITGTTRETQLAVRNLMAYGIRNGMPPRAISKHLQDQIGLTAQHQQAVLNYRDQLIKAGQIPRGQIDTMVTLYADRLRRHRALMIARTEVMYALNSGRLMVWREGVKLGHIPATARKRWITAEDERTCAVCEPMHGVTVPLDDLFTITFAKEKTATYDSPPPHPHCRCILQLVT